MVPGGGGVALLLREPGLEVGEIGLMLRGAVLDRPLLGLMSS